METIDKNSREYLVKAYAYLNNIYSDIDDTRDMHNAWEELMLYMNILDGSEARELLLKWKSAGNYKF